MKKNAPLIVVVDDTPEVVNALRRELRPSGYNVAGFTSTGEALNFLRSPEHTPLALLCDYRMPGMNGDRFLAEVQMYRPDLPCIVITGKATKQSVGSLVKSAKIRRILTKPWKKEELLEILAGFRNGDG